MDSTYAQAVKRIPATLAIGALAFLAACSSNDDGPDAVAIADDDAISEIALAPREIVVINQDFGSVRPRSWSDTQIGFHELVFSLIFNRDISDLPATDWVHSFSFGNSHVSLPDNHVDKPRETLQGGAALLRRQPGANASVIFRIGWASDSRAFGSTVCSSRVDMWYTDDDEQTPIASLDTIDSSRQVAGRPLIACEMPVSLEDSTIYRLKLNEIADAREPNAPEWWRATLVNTTSNEEIPIADIEVPGDWQWLEPRSTTTIDHFSVLEEGCAALPESNTRFFQTTADQGNYTATTSARLTGRCEATLRERATVSCDNAGCSVLVQ